jgi:zinc finger protein 830
VEEDETEIDKSRKRLQEERELIMDRLLDEERAQEDADAKVSALKARLQAIKLKRAARKAGA